MASTSIAEAKVSHNLDSKQVVNLAPIETNVSIHKLKLVPFFEDDLGLAKAITPSADEAPDLIALSIKAAKKTG